VKEHHCHIWFGQPDKRVVVDHRFSHDSHTKLEDTKILSTRSSYKDHSSVRLMRCSYIHSSINKTRRPGFGKITETSHSFSHKPTVLYRTTSSIPSSPLISFSPHSILIISQGTNPLVETAGFHSLTPFIISSLPSACPSPFRALITHVSFLLYLFSLASFCHSPFQGPYNSSIFTSVVTVEPVFSTTHTIVALFRAPSHTWPHAYLPLTGSPIFPISIN